MRVLLTIHHELDRGAGAPGVTLRLSEALGRRGHDVELFSWDDLPARLGPRARELAFPAYASRRIAALARRGLDVADCSTGDAWPFLTRPARPRSPVVITRTHGLEHRFRLARHAQAEADGEPIGLPERAYHDGVRLREVAASLRRADLALFLNRGDRDFAVERLGVSAGRAAIVPNGIDPGLLGLPAPESPERGGPLRLAQVGSWDPRKGVGTTVEALRLLAAGGCEPELRLLGVRAPADEVRSAFGAEARDRVTVVERYAPEELPALLADAEVLLLPSLAEGFSLALLEGMACGLAPIASDVGAAGDLLEGDAGLLVEPGSAEALAGAIRALDDDRERLLACRRVAHRRAQGYGWDAVAELTERLYARTIAARA